MENLGDFNGLFHALLTIATMEAERFPDNKRCKQVIHHLDQAIFSAYQLRARRPKVNPEIAEMLTDLAEG